MDDVCGPLLAEPREGERYCVKQIFSAFERAYIINLVDREDRKRGVLREPGRLGMEAPSGKIQFYEARRPTDIGNFPALGARGSFNSHRAVLDLALRDRLGSVLVLEDDVGFRKVSPPVVARIMAAMHSEKWDVIYFGYLKPEAPPQGGLVRAEPLTLGGHFFAVNGPFIAEMSDYMHACERRPRDHPMGGPTSGRRL